MFLENKVCPISKKNVAAMTPPCVNCYFYDERVSTCRIVRTDITTQQILKILKHLTRQT